MTVPLAGLRKCDVAIAGGKAANLGEVTSAGIPVPAGFVVTVAAYDEFLEVSGLRARLGPLLERAEITNGTSSNGANEIGDLFSSAEMPQRIASAILNAYAAMGHGPVAVRSSATAEDLAEASFAGQQETFLNVEDGFDVLLAVQSCWASLFEARAIHYRSAAGFGQLDAKMAVVVQRMVQADRSGVMFTVNPVTNDGTQVLIEAAYGLGEAVVSGALTPDMYIVCKRTGAILDCQVAAQERELRRRTDMSSSEECNEWSTIDWDRRSRQKLVADEISALAKIGIRLERHFGCPQDIEWASEAGAFYIVQARPVTGLN